MEGLTLDKANIDALGNALYTITLTEDDNKRTEKFDIAKLIKNVFVLTASMVGSKAGEKLAEALLKPFSITSGVTEKVARSRAIEPQVREIVMNINAIIADVETKAGKPLLVVIDGLDKWHRLDQAKLIFLESNALRRPLCRIIYTVPMLIQTLPEFTQVMEEAKSEVLPNIKLYHKSDPEAKYEQGYVFMREVLDKRLNEAGLKQDDIFEPHAVEELIKKSGGVMRWYISLVRDSCLNAKGDSAEKVSLQHVHSAVSDFVATLTSSLTVDHITELKAVHAQHRPSGNTICHELLHTLYIVAYRNGSTWYDAHPLLWNEL